MLQYRTEQKGWIEQIADAVREINGRRMEELFDDVVSSDLKMEATVSTEQEVEGKGENQIQDECPPQQPNLYHSYIHEQIPLGNHNEEIEKENSIQQVIEIYNSKVYNSPQKSVLKTPETHRKKLKSGYKESPSGNHQKLLRIEREKQRMQEELRRLNEEMKEIKKQENESRLVKRDRGVSQEVEAAEQAQRMLMRIQKERRQLQEKKNKEQIRLFQQLEREAGEKEIQRRENIERIRAEKREQIIRKIEDKKKEREEKSIINKQSNKLIKELKKSESAAKDHGGLFNNLVEKKKSLYMVRNLSEKNGENSRSVLTEEPKQIKDNRVKPKIMNRKEEGEEYPKPLVHYPRGKFLEILQEEEKKRREEDKQKQDGKKQALEKRMKYGELIKNLFIPVPSKSKEKSNLVESRVKPPTPDIPSHPKTRTSFERKTQNSVYKKQTKSKELSKVEGEQSEKNSHASRQNSEQKRRRQQRQREIRRETLLRLKKAEKKDQVLNSGRNPPKVQRYSNYLKQLPKPKNPQNNWKKILQNQNLTKQQKYSEMISQVNQMEIKAKLNQQYNRGEDETMNLIIGSIQAKLALLDEL